ncbi:MAG: DivIVA domain-containing protein [Acidimicrobiia bacterium]
MNVKAATVEQHEFAIRRRGYDQAEVDAVMGQLSRSLRYYEQEKKDLEAKLAQAGHAGKTASPPAKRGQGRAAKHRTESELMRQTGDAVEGARQQAEAILAEARAAIDKMFDSIASEAKQVLATAESDAAKHKDKIEKESAKLLADSLAKAEATKKAAATEAAELRAKAAGDAAATVAKAQAEHDKLATRMPELRTALSQFEAQVHALTNVPVADLNEVEATEAAAKAAEVEVTIGSDAATGAAEAALATASSVARSVAAPDGSGMLPAARDLVNLDEYRDLKASPVEEEAPVPAPTKPEPALSPAASDSAPLERLASTHVASRVIPTDNETIYQRRGGGLRRRINSQGDE